MEQQRLIMHRKSEHFDKNCSRIVKAFRRLSLSASVRTQWHTCPNERVLGFIYQENNLEVGDKRGKSSSVS